MDRLWAPWRSAYINGVSKPKEEGKKMCVFCEALQSEDDKAHYVVARSQYTFVIMNLYPYNNGHMLIIPNRHVSKPEMLNADELHELMDNVTKACAVLEKVYHPHGINVGANIGGAAGAGIADHMHFHVLPRWNADANFMTTIGDSRVIPESLEESWKKIRDAWNAPE